MTNIRRISEKEIKKARRQDELAEAPPNGISPILRSSWNFAKNSAKRFSQELLTDRTKEFLQKLAKRFYD